MTKSELDEIWIENDLTYQRHLQLYSSSVLSRSKQKEETLNSSHIFFIFSHKVHWNFSSNSNFVSFCSSKLTRPGCVLLLLLLALVGYIWTLLFVSLRILFFSLLQTRLFTIAIVTQKMFRKTNCKLYLNCFTPFLMGYLILSNCIFMILQQWYLKILEECTPIGPQKWTLHKWLIKRIPYILAYKSTRV